VSDSDLLVRAAKALREAHTGEREGSGFTRARIMNTLHRERRSRVLRWAIVSPLASVLLVGSAWAQSTGRWPVIWKAVASVFVAAPTQKSAPAAPRRSNEPPAPVAAPVPDAALDVVPSSPPPEPSETSVPRPPEPPPAEPRPARQRHQRRPAPAASSRRLEGSAASGPAQQAEPPPEPERDRELYRFRAAHDLHFSGSQPREAIQAYSDYLREFPNGRFVPEARYNVALDQIKLGNAEAAREALAPFAAGKFGGYRQKEARELLEALRRKQPGSP
jgi:hypothetical protein